MTRKENINTRSKKWRQGAIGACFCRHGALISSFSTLSIHYMGRRFLYSYPNSSAYLGTVECIKKTCVQNRTTAGGKRRAAGSWFFSTAPAPRRAAGVPVSVSVLDSAQKALHIASSRPKPAHGGKCENRHLHSIDLELELTADCFG